MVRVTLCRNKYRVESRRLKGWDYQSPAEYFVTIDTKGMVEWFGEVKERQAVCNEIGQMARRIWMEIPNHHKNVALDDFVIMPNHLHGIVVLCCHLDCDVAREDSLGSDANIRVATENNVKSYGGATNLHNPMLSRRSLGYIVRWYKGRVSFEIHKQNPDFAWQPRFYDHIIRNDNELNRIREYIRNNPLRWEIDHNNPAAYMNWFD